MKKIFKISSWIILSLFICFGCLCSCVEKDGSKEKVVCTGITFKAKGYDEGKTLYMQRGEEITIVGTISPNDTTDKIIVWTTSNSDIAVTSKDDTKAVIKAYDLGSAEIFATCGEYSTKIKVECVLEVLPTQLNVETTSLNISVTKRAKIEYTLNPENTTNKKITYSIAPLKDANPDMISLIEENDEYFVSISQLAATGDQYSITLRSVANTELKKVITVTVGALEVDSMTFRSTNISLSLQDPLYRLTPIFEPIEASYKEVIFESSDAAICEVNEIGDLIPKQTGIVTITAKNVHNNSISCQTQVEITNTKTDYVTRLIKKSQIDDLTSKTYSVMDFESDKVAFSDWQKAISEDSNTSSHISDAGWAIWMVGFDTYDDDSEDNGAANTAVYCKLNVPTSAKKMQYVFRSHPTPDDLAKFKILAITSDYKVNDCTSGWVVMNNNTDMFIDIDVSAFAGQAVTFVVLQDQIGNKAAGSNMKVSLMFRRCLFDTDTSDRWIDDETYSILNSSVS